MNKKVKVLHYVPGFDHGGIESRLLDWYKNIDRGKIQFDVLKLTPDKNNPLIDEFKNLGGNVYTLPKFSPKTLFNFFRELNRFFDNHNDYQVVHCHSPLTGKFILKKAKQKNIPIRIMHSRTTQFNQDSKFMFIRNWIKETSYTQANHYFACSEEAGEWLFGEEVVKKGLVKIINNGIESEKFIYNNEKRIKLRNQLNLGDSLVIGNIGRFSVSKNHIFMIQIFNEINKRKENIKLMLIGDGPELESVKKKVRDLDLIDKVLFMGRKKNVEDYLQCMDLFLFPSQFEGFGTAVVEAQAAGLRTIASDGVPSSVDITDLIEHLPLSAGAEVWANAIIKYSAGYERENMREEIVKAGFDVKSVAKYLEGFYMGEFSREIL